MKTLQDLAPVPNQQVLKIKEMFNDLCHIDSTGNVVPRPGVTLQQMVQFRNMVYEIKAKWQEVEDDIDSLEVDVKKSAEGVSQVRNRMLGIEKKIGKKVFSPLLHQMFGL